MADKMVASTGAQFLDPQARYFVAGARGLVGSALVRALKKKGCEKVLQPGSKELDLRDSEATRRYFQENKPDFVFLAAAKVGGIVANNTYPVEFLLENLKIQNNVLESSHATGVEKLLFLGSSCIYPKFAKQPMPESELLNGHLEPTNSAYAIAKIAGIQLAQSYQREYGRRYISVMPTNLYGQNDQYHPTHSHVIPGLIRRFHAARTHQKPEEVVWGSGSPKREFLHADDLADACLFLMKNYESPEIINIGSGQEVSIAELSQLVKDVVGYQGKLSFDASKPDGTPRKLLDTSRLDQLGWKAKIQLKEGLQQAYADYLAHGAPHSEV